MYVMVLIMNKHPELKKKPKDRNEYVWEFMCKAKKIQKSKEGQG